VEADQQQRQAEDEGEGDEPGPGLAQRGGEIVVLAGMMVHMARPHPADAMCRAMEPRNKGQII
jgi:hypothetical protein